MVLFIYRIGVRDWQQAGVWDLIHFALLDWLARDDHSTVTSPPLVGCSGLLGRSQEHGLALALTLDVPQPLPEPHDSYCVVISE